MKRIASSLLLAVLACIGTTASAQSAADLRETDKIKKQVRSLGAAMEALDTRSPGEIAADEAAAAAPDAAQAAADSAAAAADAVALDQADAEIKANGGTVVYSYTRDGVRQYTTKRPSSGEWRRIPIPNLKGITAASAPPKLAERWQEFYAEGNSTDYIDKQTITKELQDHVAWIMRSFRTPETILGFRNVSSIKSQGRYDCRRRTIKIVQTLFYGPDGKLITSESYPSYRQATPVAPESVGELELSAVCSLAGSTPG